MSLGKCSVELGNCSDISVFSLDRCVMSLDGPDMSVWMSEHRECVESPVGGPMR